MSLCFGFSSAIAAPSLLLWRKKEILAVIKKHLSRRDFLKGLGLGGASTSVLGKFVCRAGAAPFADGNIQGSSADGSVYQKTAKPARVSLVKGNDRRQIVLESLKQIEGEILTSIGDKKILIKPNMAVSKNPLAVTHVDAVRAVLDFLTPHYKNQIIIGESGVLNTVEGYRNNGYLALEKEYHVKLLDLNLDSSESWYIFGREEAPQRVRIISTFLDPDVYLISLARMKTHDTVLVTLALKNILMASPMNDYKRSDKGLLHGATKSVNDILHFNMFHLAQKVYPDLAVIDGFEAMEGDGPAWGTPFEAKVALSSRDALAADTVATKIMGFDPKIVLYLRAMTEAGMGQGDLGKVNILGAPLDECLYKFKPHKKMAEIYNLA
jgi:uncharacterized protein (DUF362 family)